MAIVIRSLLALVAWLTLATATACPQAFTPTGDPSVDKKAWLQSHIPQMRVGPDCEPKFLGSKPNPSFIPSVTGVLWPTLTQIQDFLVGYSAPLCITGGSEPGGHTSSTQGTGHSDGLKVDLRISNTTDTFNDSLSGFILNPLLTHPFSTPCRSDGAPQYEDVFGLRFAMEYPVPQFNSPGYKGPPNCQGPADSLNHWDILSSFNSVDVFPLDQTGLQIEVGNTSQITPAAETASGHVIPTQSFMFDYNIPNDPNGDIAFVGDDGTIVGVGVGSVTLMVSEGPFFVLIPVNVTAQIPPPGGGPLCPAGGSIPPTGCWQWVLSANNGAGGWVWMPGQSNTGGNVPPSPPPGPQCPGNSPANPLPSGCWIWTGIKLAGGNGVWVFVPPPHKPPSRTRRSVSLVSSIDPNDIAGLPGAGGHRYVAGSVPLNYSIFYENQSSATAPAQRVSVADFLDPNIFDLSTLRLGPITVAGNVVQPPSFPLALHPFSSSIDLRPGTNLLVQLDASVNPSTGGLSWTLQSIDPETGQPPIDPLAGFLPPGADGAMSLFVSAKPSLITGTVVKNQATIVFDANPAIPTPSWFNTIDSTAPTSFISPLPPTQGLSSFPVIWQGNDADSGVQDFTVYVSDNGGPFVSWLSQTTTSQSTFSGTPGHTYAFFALARDFVGNVEALKTNPEATTTVVADGIPPTTVTLSAPPANANGWNNSNVTVNLTATDNPGGSGVQQITFSAAGAQPISTTNIPGSTTSALISTEGLTSFSFFATDLAANVEPAQTLTIKLDKTPPSITGVRTPGANSNGWNNTDVTTGFTCADALSGLAADSPPTPTLVSTEGANQQVSGACQDLAGNTASATVSGINIDKTPPSIAPSRTPAANANGWNNTNVTVSFTCADALSGLAPGNPPGAAVLASEGTNQQVSGTCFDLAGNSVSAAVSGINIDKTPPALSGLPAAGCTLWPPDHKFVTVATISAADILSGLASFNVTGTSNEPQNANDPDIIIAGTGLGPRTVQLRADRLGTGTGRIYTINTIASDAAGNVVNSTSTCTVPHDQAP
jgi:hypothetical protein